MNRWLWIVGTPLAAGMVQFGLLASAGVADVMALIAGVVGAMGTSLAGLMKQLPRQPWTDEERHGK